MSEWQPIETAPKDGSTILVYAKHPYGDVRIARWDARPEYRWEQDGPDAMKRVPTREKSQWFTQQVGWDDLHQMADEDEEYAFIPAYEPTHWLPMPAAPKD